MEDYKQRKTEAAKSGAKQAVIDFAKNERADWLLKARDLAYRIALAEGSVTADQIHERLPIPEGIDRRIVGSVFDGMQCIRYQKSKRKQCHCRPIGVFTIREKK